MLLAVRQADILAMGAGADDMRIAYHRISAVLLHVHAIYRHSTYIHSHILPQGYGNKPESDDAAPYCCPTPPVEPDQCSSGAVTKTKYVRDEIR